MIIDGRDAYRQEIEPHPGIDDYPEQNTDSLAPSVRHRPINGLKLTRAILSLSTDFLCFG
jgi:hypothetical protein